MENIYIQRWLEVLIDFSHFSADSFRKYFLCVLSSVLNPDLIFMWQGSYCA